MIASDVPGLRDSVRNGETGILVPYGDKLALAQELVGLLRDPERRARMGAAGRLWAAQHTWERSAGELREIIIGQVGGHGHRVFAAMMPNEKSAVPEPPLDELPALNAS